MSYAELQVTTHFSFLRGASSADELFRTAKELGISALGIVDRNSLAGIVRALEASRATGLRLVVGCRLDLADGMSILVYPMDRAAYSRLTRLLTLGKGRGGKANCILHLDDVALYAEGLIGILVPDLADETCALQLRKLAEIFGDRAYLSLCLRRRPNDQLRLHELSHLAARFKVKTVVTNDVLFHEPSRWQLQDIVTCIRNVSTIDDIGFERERHADRFLKPPEEMERLFPRYPEALARTLEIVERCTFSLEELTYQYPEEAIVPGKNAQESLEHYVWECIPNRYPEGLPPSVLKVVRHELDLIRTMSYAPYFLTVFSIVRYARSQGILCQGGGSAANSAVCYILGITSIDPETNNLLFERFVSQERDEPPDIDVDFEHERREEVIQWIYRTYGHDKAALCATVTRYRAKGAIRDVGKALGLPEDVIKSLSSGMWSWSEELVTERGLRELNLNPDDRRLALTLKLAQQLMGAPRHLGQHPGGFVLTHDRLDDLVPIEPATMADRQVIEWDKDDVEALKFMKVDVLALGMVTCMSKAFALIRDHKYLDLDLIGHFGEILPAKHGTTVVVFVPPIGRVKVEERSRPIVALDEGAPREARRSVWNVRWTWVRSYDVRYAASETWRLRAEVRIMCTAIDRAVPTIEKDRNAIYLFSAGNRSSNGQWIARKRLPQNGRFLAQSAGSEPIGSRERRHETWEVEPVCLRAIFELFRLTGETPARIRSINSQQKTHANDRGSFENKKAQTRAREGLGGFLR
nr:PHP domain-containing protein [Rhizobium sp. AG207R]